jgi:hypothetical protein
MQLFLVHKEIGLKSGEIKFNILPVEVVSEKTSQFWLERNPSQVTRLNKMMVDTPPSRFRDAVGRFYSSKKEAIISWAAFLRHEKEQLDFMIEAFKQAAKEK